MTAPYADLSAENLLRLKEETVVAVAEKLSHRGIAADYPVNLVPRLAELPLEERISLLEALLEIEAMKYTLAARRVRELEPEE